MRGGINHQEAHRNIRIEVVLVFEIVSNIKRQPIDAGFEACVARQHLRDSAIIVGETLTRSYELSAMRYMLGSHPHSWSGP